MFITTVIFLKSQSLAFRKKWNDNLQMLITKYIQCFKFMLSFWKNVLGNVCLGFFGADAILEHAKAWDLVLWKFPRRSMAGCLTIIFAGSFHYFKPVSCWILFSENVTGIPEPFDQLPSHVGKVNTFKTPEMRFYFDSEIWGRWLTIIFVGSFPDIKFLTKINSKVRRK